MSNTPKSTSANITGLLPRKVLGIAERPRPANTGWCGADNCKHLTHKHFNAPAKAAK
jgi:hypothetical protein